MPYYYSTPNNATSSGTASTNILQLSLVGIAGLRAAVQKIIGGTYTTPADNAILLRLYNATTNSTGPTSQLTPQPMAAGAGATAAIAAQLTAYAANSLGTLSSVPKIQLAFNQRGTAMWAAFNADEGVGIQSATAPNGELDLINQSTGLSVPVYTNVIHSE